MPWGAQDCRHEQDRAEMDDGWRAEGVDSAGVGREWPVGEQRHDHELQTRERSSRRTHDDVEALPLFEQRHRGLQGSGPDQRLAHAPTHCTGRQAVTTGRYLTIGLVELRCQSLNEPTYT